MTGSQRRNDFVRKRTRARNTTAARVRTTLGELIVAAFDIVGNRVPDVAHLLASRELGRAAHGRIVLVR
jgi:hypothetical protein